MSMSGIQSLVVHGTVNFVGGNTSNSERPPDRRFTTYVSRLVFSPQAKGRRKDLGEEHPHTLASMANLSGTYYQQGQGKEAEELALQTLEIQTKVLGHNHPRTLETAASS